MSALKTFLACQSWLWIGIVVAVIPRLTVGDDMTVSPPANVAEARARARLLHETFHATLHIVHQRYYREDEGLIIPAKTLEAVFDELERSCGVKIRWLAVNAQAMNVDHLAQDALEKAAVKALANGEHEYESVGENQYQRVSAITLTSECLKCHVPHRKSLEDRTAGLLISMKINNR